MNLWIFTNSGNRNATGNYLDYALLSLSCEKGVPENFAGKHLCLHVSAQLLFTTSDTVLHYYHHQKVNILVASPLAQRLRKFRKLENFKKIPEMLGSNGE